MCIRVFGRAAHCQCLDRDPRHQGAKVSENSVKIVPAQGDNRSQDFLRALQLHLELLAEDYPGTVKVTISEV